MVVVVIYSDYVCNIIFINYGHMTPIKGDPKSENLWNKWTLCTGSLSSQFGLLV